MPTTTYAARLGAAFVTSAVLGLAAFSGTAAAAPSTPSSSSAAATEDTDTNDGTANNVVDDGDNAHPSGRDRSVEEGGSGNQGKTPADPDDNQLGPERTNRGTDQADGPGGDDLADQDGNNGCGNDDDFEDDNEGHCRRPAASSSPAPGTPNKPNKPGNPGTPTNPSSPNGSTPTNPASPTNPGGNGGVGGTTTDGGSTPTSPGNTAVLGTAVLGAAISVPAPSPSPATSASASSRPAEVLGAHLERSSAAGGRATEVLGVTYQRADLARTGALATMEAALAGLALVVIGLGLRRFGARRS